MLPMRWMASCIAICVALAFAPACGGGPSQADCENLFDHVLELEIQAAGAGNTDKQALDKLKKKLAQKMSKEIIDGCLKDLPKSQVKCGLSSKTLDELAGCDK